MEDSGEEPTTNNIDPSVGGLVWVRRRNGSWWPGQIMDVDELPKSCLVSPKSGTPVKLLGRADASVDWYNLEKSKRVKAFRCGEYVECIEKAKASAASGNKKVVKYARREDAILHALEIENTCLGKEDKDFYGRMDNLGAEQGNLARESPSVHHSGDDKVAVADEVSDSVENLDSELELSQSSLSFEEPNQVSASKVQAMQERRRKTPNDSEDDGTEGIKRMRGLEDLGMGVVSKRKVQAGEIEVVQRGCALLCDSNTGNCTSNGNFVNGKANSSSLKRKRSQVANINEYLRRKNRRRPLTKVLESTAMVSVPVVCDQLASSAGLPLQSLSDCKVSGLESNGSKKSIDNNSDSTGISCENGATLNASEHACDMSNVNYKTKENETSGISGLAENESSDRLFDVPFVGEEKHSAGAFVSCSSGRPQVSALGRQSSQGSKAEAVSLRNEGPNESNLTSLATVHVNNISQRIEKGTSKWQLKGKRNSRHININRKQDLKKYVVMDDESNTYLAGIEHWDAYPRGSDQKVDFRSIGVSAASYESSLPAKTKSVAEDPADRFPDWHRHISHREPRMRGRGVTAEAKLLPEESLIPQRSLPYRHSRFTVPSRYQTHEFHVRNFSFNSALHDVHLEVKASYRPQHVPLVSLMSKLNGKAIVGHPLTVEVLDDSSFDLLLCSVEYKANNAATCHATRSNSEAGRIRTKHMASQPPKIKKCGFLSKKIRKLSSLTGSHKRKEERKPVVDKRRGPTVACIPLTLVFSRINEAVNASARSTHRALTSCNP